jgi:hypothetical protein
VAKIMDAWQPPLPREDGALSEQRLQTAPQGRAAVSSSTLEGIPDSGSFSTVLAVRLCLLFAMECGLQLPWRKHYSVLDFLTSSAFVSTNPTDEPITSGLP